MIRTQKHHTIQYFKKLQIIYSYNLLSYSKSIKVEILAINKSGKDIHSFNNLIIRHLSLFLVFAVRARAQVIFFCNLLMIDLKKLIYSFYNSFHLFVMEEVYKILYINENFKIKRNSLCIYSTAKYLIIPNIRIVEHTVLRTIKDLSCQR